jgi:serine/threonine protein phosphatase PrpC
MTFALRYAVRSDVGLLREGNEDSAYAGPHLLAIADGMGGHAAGEVASAVAISALAPLDADTTGLDMLQALADAVAHANASLHEITQTDPATEGMGTTLTALLWAGAQVALCHIGDSRAYLLRGGEFYQITHDHTLVQSLVDEGRLTPEAAASHPQRSLVMRALQSSIPADPDLTMLQAELGDRYLLCSDGLSDVVSDETLGKTLSQLPDLDEAVEQLIDLAIRSGGPDNITCVLADVVDTETGPAPPSEQAVIVGALANGDGPPPARGDSPATRAHLLTHGSPQSDQTADQVASGLAAGALATSGLAASALVTSGLAAGALATSGLAAGGLATSSQPRADGVAGASQLTASRPDVRQPDDDEQDDEEAAAPLGRRRRRRWPVVTFILGVLVGVIGAGGYYGWNVTQHQYFVGTTNGRVTLFRGLNEPVAGISLFSVVQQTAIPVAAMPGTEAQQVRKTISASNLADARRIVQRLNRGYECHLAQAAISRWAAARPRIAAVGKRSAHGKRLMPTQAAPKLPAYPSSPAMPAFCTALSGVSW